MVSRTDYVHTIRDAVVLILVAGLITQSFADDAKNIKEKRQLENEWASTSKKDHKGPGTYEFRYDVENAPSNNIQYRMEERHPNGSIVGSYGQVQPDGKIRVVSYVADKNGIKTHVKDGGGGGDGTKPAGAADLYVAEGSSLDPVQRVTSQIIQTAVKSQQQHKSPLHDKYHRPTPSTAAAAGQRVDTAHAYHQQRTNLDPAAFRPEDSPGYQETNQPFVGDQLKDKLHSTQAEYRVTPGQQPQPQLQLQPAQNVQPLAPVVPYSLQGPAPTQQPSHYVLNVPPLPSLGDNSPLPLLPGQQPLPITPDHGPIMIQLQQPQPQPQAQYQYHPVQHQQQQQQQLVQPNHAQLYQQQPVRVQPPLNLQSHHQQPRLVPNQLQQQQQQQQPQNVQYQPQQTNRVVTQQALPPQYLQQQQQLQLQQLQQQQQQQQQQLQLQRQQNAPYQQSVIRQPYSPQQVNIPAHPSQLQVKGNVQQHHAVVPMQFFHQPNPATTLDQYRQQLQLQAAESQMFPVFVLPPRKSSFDFEGKRFRF